MNEHADFGCVDDRIHAQGRRVGLDGDRRGPMLSALDSNHR